MSHSTDRNSGPASGAFGRWIRDWRALGLLIALGALAGLGAVAYAQASCTTCKPARITNPSIWLEGEYRVCISAAFEPEDAAHIEAAVNSYWPRPAHLVPFSFDLVYEGDESCSNTEMFIEIESFDPASDGLSYATANGQGSWVKIHSDFMAGNNSTQYFQSLLIHEFGHILGFEDSSPSGCAAYSFMAFPFPVDSYSTDRCADAAAKADTWTLEETTSDDVEEELPPQEPEERCFGVVRYEITVRWNGSGFSIVNVYSYVLPETVYCVPSYD